MKKKFEKTVDPSAYSNLHSDPNCDGKFEASVTFNAIFSDFALGPVKINFAPMAVCHKCQSGFIIPEFRTWLEKRLCDVLLFSEGSLTKKQIKFLRQFLNFTQQELSEKLGIADRHELSKMESKKSTRVMPEDKQLRLRLLVAKHMGISDSEQLYRINENLADSEVKISTDELVSKEEAEQFIRTA